MNVFWFFSEAKQNFALAPLRKAAWKNVLLDQTGASERAAGGQLSGIGKARLEDFSQAMLRKMGISSRHAGLVGSVDLQDRAIKKGK